MAMGGSLGEARRGRQGDDTRVKLKVLVQRTDALCFGIAADVKCDLSVTLTHCQQSLPLIDVSAAAGIWPGAWKVRASDAESRRLSFFSTSAGFECLKQTDLLKFAHGDRKTEREETVYCSRGNRDK
ncbi:hypothetical protein PAMA_011313 [Pampus argenteus]